MPQTDDWQYDPIFERELTTRRPAGGTIRSVEIAQLPSSEWIINVRVSWRDDKWLNVCLWEQPTIKTYKRLSSAIRHVVFDYGYEDDHIRVVPNKECSNRVAFRSEEHTSELQSLMRISYAVFCLKKKKRT